MNRYPVWKYILIVIALLFGALYTAPNYFGESPALQVTSGKSTVKVTGDTASRVEEALKSEGIAHDGISVEGAGATTSVRARFRSPDEQFKAKLALEHDLNRDPEDADYIVTVNLAKNTPQWMQAVRALPMNLGLDLRGGVHFLMQVDTKAAVDTRIKGLQAGIRSQLR
ncbi:MAG TPA: protein translocase subunit SecD, partial [Telluria sp.]|nr:protein translocase subunit SecD [Telluria sp.]